MPHVQSRGPPRARPLGFDRPFRLCKYFKAGRCTKVDCTFAHGETERAAWEAVWGAANNMLEEEASGAAPSGAGAEAAAAPAADAAAAAANGAGVGGLFAQLAQVQQAAQAAAAQAAAGTAAAE